MKYKLKDMKKEKINKNQKCAYNVYICKIKIMKKFLHFFGIHDKDLE